VAVVVKSRPGGRGCAGRPSLVEPGGSSGGKRGLPRGGSMHDSCPDCAGTQPKRTIIPVYPKSQSVTRWLGPVTCHASLTPGRPGGLCPGAGERACAWTRRWAGAGEGAGCPGRDVLAGAGVPGRGGGPGRARARGARAAAGWPGEMRLYRLRGHSTIGLLELLSGVREDHPKVVLE